MKCSVKLNENIFCESHIYNLLSIVCIAVLCLCRLKPLGLFPLLRSRLNLAFTTCGTHYHALRLEPHQLPVLSCNHLSERSTKLPCQVNILSSASDSPKRLPAAPPSPQGIRKYRKWLGNCSQELVSTIPIGMHRVRCTQGKTLARIQWFTV